MKTAENYCFRLKRKLKKITASCFSATEVNLLFHNVYFTGMSVKVP